MAVTQQHGDLGMLGKSVCLLVVACRSLPCFSACTNMIQASGVTIGSQACIPVPSNIFRKLFYSIIYKGRRSLTVTSN